jgi:hypothetical protein
MWCRKILIKMTHIPVRIYVISDVCKFQIKIRIDMALAQVNRRRKLEAGTLRDVE